MPNDTFTCPRCLAETNVRIGVRYCPRCGLSDPVAAANDALPLQLRANGRSYRVLDRIAVGSIASLYRCTFDRGGNFAEGVFKLARDAKTNDLIANEASVLNRLHAGDPSGKFAPFLPRIEASLSVGGGGASDEPARLGNVLGMHDGVRRPEELYSLSEVLTHFPAGLDARHVAWIWRRLLHVLAHAHAQDVVHAAVLPPHVLIEPRGHKLLVVGWCCAVARAAQEPRVPELMTGGYAAWYRRQGTLRQPATPALDVGLAARSMIQLLGGDPVRAEFPGHVNPALKRYFQRCLAGIAFAPGPQPDAGRLLADFDRLIEVLWGPRTFVPLELPAKPRPR